MFRVQGLLGYGIAQGGRFEILSIIRCWVVVSLLNYYVPTTVEWLTL